MITHRPRLTEFLLPLGLLFAAIIGILLGGRSGMQLAGFSIPLLTLGAVGMWLTSTGAAVERRVPLRGCADMPLSAEVRILCHRPLPWVMAGVRDLSPQLLSDGGPATLSEPLLLRRSLSLHWTATPRRGVYLLPPVVVTLRDPFGIFERTILTVPVELTVWPKRIPIPVHSLAFRTGGFGEELRGTRPFTAGDSPRHIVWRRYAREGRLEVRHFTEHPDEPLRLSLAAIPADAFELIVSAAASIIESSLRAGRPVGLAVEGAQTVDPALGEAQLTRLMDLLARVVPASSTGEIMQAQGVIRLQPDPNESTAGVISLGGRTRSFRSLEEFRERMGRWASS